jgi:hypothetical protein
MTAPTCLFCGGPATPGRRDCPACREKKRRQLDQVFARAALTWKPPPLPKEETTYGDEG